ncbi:unnamed protein product [Triticum turgidum subsp. durum]|uniref:Protein DETOXIFICATION n=1 Tax=Triticum turgidum subsp. durum TaxID=4567 RepID=A0A9R1QY41_TRITD|nr:unnamed protein product [Triticum turgidum subsp. durum]
MAYSLYCQCCCWMWMATVCCIREHWLLLHRRRTPWHCSRFCLQPRRKGIWSGMIGGTTMQTAILLWVTIRTDWSKEVEEAHKRLNKWDDTKKQPLLTAATDNS